ncbi:MAG: ABC transporter ATP-binding protein [Clostridia bacterium]|nr:ABC transporter ATP-binding protein [Clostridia bacterium]
MIRILKKLRKKDILLIIISIAFIAVQVWLDLKLPDYMSEITLLVQTPDNEMTDILAAGIKMLLCALGSLVSAVAVSILCARIATDFGADLRSGLYNKVLSFSKGEISKFSTASLITRSTNDVMQVQMLILMGLQSIIKAPLMGTWAIIKIAGKNTEWTITTAIAVMCLMVVVVLAVALMLPKFRKIQKMTDDLNRITRENLNGISVIRAYNAEDYQQNKFDATNNYLTKANLFTGRVSAFMMPSIQMIMNGLSLSIYWLGAALIDSAGIQQKIGLFSDMIVFSQYAMQVVMAFMMLVMLFIMLPRASVSAKRILEVFDSPVYIQDGNIFSNAANCEGEIEFKNVSFRYPDGEGDVIENISFTAKKGETVAVIGSTGSGKTALIDLIPRFYDATSGEVLVDGVNVKDYKLKTLRNKIGYVSQKATLFSGTVRSNVIFGDSKHDLSQNFVESIYTAQAADFVEKMEKGYDGVISQDGANLSGGQKQRLSIARAICRRPEILIFDDSFSALDYKTDRTLRQKMNKDCKNITKLIVAQRIGTIRDADRIIVLDEGKMVGYGKHSYLMENCEVYRQIAYSQLSKEELA